MSSESVYHIEIPYDGGKTIESVLAEQTHLGWVSPLITDKQFPCKITTPERITVMIKHFGTRLSTDDALEQITSVGMRPTTVAEAIVLSRYLRKEEYPVACLDVYHHPKTQERYVPLLFKEDGGEIRLYLYLAEGRWREFTGFSVVAL